MPKDGRIPRNGMKVILKASDLELRLRIFAYKVTSSGRNRPQERRVEITTTYRSSLTPLRGFGDLVLGIDVATGKYVGIDSRRLQFGGPTHNASSFFDLEGLSVKSGEFLINPRRAAQQLFPGGIEQHCFFDRSRLPEYLFNCREIHTGSYAYSGAFKGKIAVKTVSFPIAVSNTKLMGDTFVLFSRTQKRSRPMASKLIEAVEEKNFSKLQKRGITPEQLKRLLAICEEIGALGEQAVLTFERKRLTTLGFISQANKVERVSLRSVGEGFDIASFEDDGFTPRYLEVKSTVGRSSLIEMSRGEWRAAEQYRDRYYVVRVTDAKTSPVLHFIRDPFKLEQEGSVAKTATGWQLDLRAVM